MSKTFSISRRNFIKGAMIFGGVLVAGGLWRAIDNGVFNSGNGIAYAAWGMPTKGMEALVNSAILAANAHNTQPWKFKITNSSIDIFADKKRNIGTADPYFREMYISLGCALENLKISAEAKGYSAKITYLPDPLNNDYIAKVDLTTSNPSPSELYGAITNRRMNRGAYDKNRPIPKEMLQSFMDVNKDSSEVKLFLFDSPADKQKIGKYMIEATEAFIADPDQARDDAKWMKQSWSAVEQQKDGITLDAQALPSFMLTVAKMLPPMSIEQNNKFWLDTVKTKQIPTSAAFGCIAVRDLNNLQQIIKAGQLWQSLHLLGTAKGMGMQIMNQLSERRDRELSLGAQPVFGNKLVEILGDSKWNSVVQFRLGYPTLQPLHSPRRPVSEVLI